MNSKNTDEKNLAIIICMSESGYVKSNSMVPVLLSSENERIVIAGTRNKKTSGAMLNNPLISANPREMMFSDNGNTQRKSPVSTRNTPITIYPVRELRKPFISFKNKLYISPPYDSDNIFMMGFLAFSIICASMKISFFPYFRHS